MIVAIWIIAVCEVLRMVQNFLQLKMLHGDKDIRKNAYEEFVKSLKSTDAEFVKRLLEEFEEDQMTKHE